MVIVFRALTLGVKNDDETVSIDTVKIVSRMTLFSHQSLSKSLFQALFRKVMHMLLKEAVNTSMLSVYSLCVYNMAKIMLVSFM